MSPSDSLLLVLVFGFVVSFATANVTSCGGCGWTLHGSACYWISSDVDSVLSWDDAKSACERRQAILASVNNVNHDFLVAEMSARGSMHWMGFYKPAGQNTFEYLDGSDEDPYLPFRDGDRAKPSVEKKSEDCAGIAYTDTISDIWWEDEKCKNTNYYICMKSAAQGSSSITTTTVRAKTSASTAETSTMTVKITTTAENITKMSQIKIDNYKSRKSRTVPPTSDPVSVISGVSAIVIIVGVVAFIIGDDVTGVLCQMKVCSPTERLRYTPTVNKDETSHTITFTLEREESPKMIDVLVRFTNHYCCAVKPNGKLMKTHKLDAAYLVQNGNDIEIWVKHMAFSTSKSKSTFKAGRCNLPFEQIIRDRVAKSQSSEKYTQSDVDTEKGEVSTIEGRGTNFRTISSWKRCHTTRVDLKRYSTGHTYRRNEKNKTSFGNKYFREKPYNKVQKSDTKKPRKSDIFLSNSTSRDNIHSGRELKKQPEVLQNTSTATYMGSVKTRQKHPQSTTYIGSVN